MPLVSKAGTVAAGRTGQLDADQPAHRSRAAQCTTQHMDARRRSLLRGRWADAGATPPTPPPRPPWALRPDDAFTGACTRCGDCVRACPENILATGDGGYPVISFATAGCSLCGDCRRVCAPGALQGDAPLPAFAWRAHIESSCLAHLGVECRICGDACDARALRFVPMHGSVAQPQLQPSSCTGCGACVSVCPAGAMALR